MTVCEKRVSPPPQFGGSRTHPFPSPTPQRSQLRSQRLQLTTAAVQGHWQWVRPTRGTTQGEVPFRAALQVPSPPHLGFRAILHHLMLGPLLLSVWATRPNITQSEVSDALCTGSSLPTPARSQRRPLTRHPARPYSISSPTRGRQPDQHR